MHTTREREREMEERSDDTRLKCFGGARERERAFEAMQFILSGTARHVVEKERERLSLIVDASVYNNIEGFISLSLSFLYNIVRTIIGGIRWNFAQGVI